MPIPLGSDFLSKRSKFPGIMPRLLGSPKALVRVFYKVKNNNTVTVCLFAPFSPQALKNFPKYYAINDVFPGLNLKHKNSAVSSLKKKKTPDIKGILKNVKRSSSQQLFLFGRQKT